MKNRNKVLAMMPAMALGLGLAISALAEDTSLPVPASTSMHQAGENTESAAKNAYTGTVTAMDDAKITTKVKAAFATGKEVKSGDIHVSTTAGIVTLDGQVQSSDMAARVEAIARNTEGVRGVTNDLRVSSSSAQN
jgi:hyperosmotically inducible periplasmic protein